MKRGAAILTLAATAALSACATPETQVRTALLDAGLSQPIAACMADRMVDRLSLVQLNRLSGLKKLRGVDMRKVTVDEFLKRTRSLQDPEIMSVVTSSGLICAVKI
jgi:type IV pilus biogenesis protein CpaD/CtpE